MTSEGLLFSAFCDTNAADELRTAFANAVRNPLANPVGYQQILIPKGYSIFTPTFKNVDSTKTMTVGDIIVLNEYGVEFDGATGTGDNDHHLSNNKIKLMKVYSKADEFGNAAGDVMPSMGYTTAKYTTGDKQTKKWDANSTVELTNGEGLIVNNSGNTPVYFRIAGEVEVEPLISVPKGYSVFGNYTPVDMTVGDITVLNENGVEFDGATGTGDNDHHLSNNKIKLMKVYNKADEYGNAAGDVMPSMGYTTAKYTTGDKQTKKWDANSTVEFKAGEAFVVNNSGNTPVFFKLKKPIEK